jgi:hypothetical protein
MEEDKETEEKKGQEAKNVGKNGKSNNPRLSQRRDTAAIFMEWSWKDLNRALMIA